MPYKDPKKQKQAQRKWYFKNKEKLTQANRKDRKKKQEYVNKIKSQPCVDCGLTYPYYVMDLDHVDGDKINSISYLVRHGGWDKLVKEVDKCQVRCANCHRIMTFKRLQRFKNQHAALE